MLQDLKAKNQKSFSLLPVPLSLCYLFLSLFVNCLSLCYLPVDKACHGRLQPHSYSETVEHELMMEDGLETGEQEEQRGEQVAFPRRSVFIPHEAEECADNNKQTNNYIHYKTTMK